jgi:calcineurin-like phosphoesterase family protein
MIHFLSDPHFGHTRILEFEPRRREVLGATIEEHDEALLKRINSRVRPEDVLIITGDFSMDSWIRHYRDKIACRTVHLVLGNHDKKSVTYYYSCGFQMVCTEKVMKIANEYVRIRHHPYRKPWWRTAFPWQWKEKDRIKRPRDLGGFLLHGHTHSHGARINGRQINVGVDFNNYYPVSMREIESIMSKIKSEEKKKCSVNVLKRTGIQAVRGLRRLRKRFSGRPSQKRKGHAFRGRG